MNQTPTLAQTKLLPRPESHAAVVDLLSEHNLPVGDYGRAGVKSTQSIWAKVQKGETKFGEFEGRLVRILPAVARAMITHTDENAISYVLVENNQGIYANEGMGSVERHVFGDYALQGLIERKSRWAVWETMREGEDKDLAMLRGICEELVRRDPAQPERIHPQELAILERHGIHSWAGLKQRLGAVLVHQESKESFEPPLEYPGLGTLYTSHTYHLPMPAFLLRHGYATRDEEGKLNLFGWMPTDVSRDVLDFAMRRQTEK